MKQEEMKKNDYEILDSECTQHEQQFSSLK